MNNGLSGKQDEVAILESAPHYVAHDKINSLEVGARDLEGVAPQFGGTIGAVGQRFDLAEGVENLIWSRLKSVIVSETVRTFARIRGTRS